MRDLTRTIHCDLDEGMSTEVVVGSTWQHNPPGREVVRVKRIWTVGDETLVRAHPIHGGKPLVASVPVFLDLYTAADAAGEGDRDE